MKQADYKNLSIPEILKERLVEYKRLDKSQRKSWDEIKAKAKAKLKTGEN
jgi:hypothetical protein